MRLDDDRSSAISLTDDRRPMPRSPLAPLSPLAPVRAWGELASWSDARLVEAVRGEPMDEAALDVLVRRYWSMLHGRCRLLTLDGQAASDLAQDTWYRVLRARTSLRPDGNVGAYLVTIASNLWRDRNRAMRRAGPLAAGRMLSIDDRLPTHDGDSSPLADVLPDPDAIPVDERVLRTLDVDRALACLDARGREILTARYLDGESCADIGKRYGRTEQTVSGWVREAIGEVRRQLTPA